MLAVALAVASRLMLPAEPVGEKDFFHLPSEGDVRLQRISKSPKEQDWPFSVDTGQLACLYMLGQKTVYFVESSIDDDLSAEERRVVVISTNPFDLSFGNLGKHDLFAPSKGLADLIARVAPFVTLGQSLCEQPRGSELKSGEL